MSASPIAGTLFTKEQTKTGAEGHLYSIRVRKWALTMRFILGLLLGYCIRGKKRLLVSVLTTIAIVCFIVLPTIALSQLAISVRRERLSRPPQTQVPAVIGLNYEAAEMRVRNSSLKLRVLAYRYDLPVQPGVIIAQTPQGGERVDYGTVIGVTISDEDPGGTKLSPLNPAQSKATRCH